MDTLFDLDKPKLVSQGLAIPVPTTNTIGFIILRHVNSKDSDKLWLYCYNSIRTHYPENYIVIIDDNSMYEFISNIPLYNTFIIQSEYIGRGELLPYYYYSKYKFFDTAVILHDSTFINTNQIDFNVDKYKFFWTFVKYLDEDEIIYKLLISLNNIPIIEFFNDKSKWFGCFGCMMVIKWDACKHINDTYDLSKLLNVVKVRVDRSACERVIALLLIKEYGVKETYYGDIMKHMVFGANFEYSITHYKHYQIGKSWNGR